MYADKQQFNPAGQGGWGMRVGQDPQVEGSAIRSLEVHTEMERLKEQIEVISMTSETLANRLSPVRSQCGSGQAGTQTNAPEPVLCGMAAAIRSQRQRLETIQIELHRALNELEI
jgi:chaperonin cofactor prefoldin